MDESHYFNDADRGEVWEYILVNLPKHINVVLLSATLPNVEQFAEWLACTRERELCLVIKNERIVPLTHYMFVEDTLYKNPNILAAAVVSKPDEKWGEVPCAFVELKDGKKTTQTEIINFCKKHLANFKCPKFVVIGLLPKTSTGKIKKFELREKARNI